ncbi:ankyrin repeat and fibronectin type-III domain-containing protein 1-like [Labrus bergylta]|uniref:ankyrin repeat and fibronectin type-III domain-containing protein 1-like n=1 Tax=Labrus bergylta TaxID=56723 RepID=UPI003313E1A4
MSVDSENSCVLLSSRDSRTSCIFQSADEKDEIPGDESVLEMLSYSKFSDLETWLCMPSSLLLSRDLDSILSSFSSSSSSSHASHHSSNSAAASSSSSQASDPRHSTCSKPGESSTPLRSSEGDSTFLTPALGSVLPILSSTPAASRLSSETTVGVSIRKKRRLAASPGGLHWNSAGSLQRDFCSPDPSQVSARTAGGGGGGRSLPLSDGGGVTRSSERAALRKTVSIDDRLLQPTGREQPHLRLLSRLERGRKKLRNIRSLGPAGRYDGRKKSDYNLSRLAQTWTHRPAGDALIRDLKPLFYTGIPRSSLSLDR